MQRDWARAETYDLTTGIARKFGGAYGLGITYADETPPSADALIGLLVSWAATWAVLGYSPAQSAAITAMFFGLSFTRSFIIRRIFRRLT